MHGNVLFTFAISITGFFHSSKTIYCYLLLPQNTKGVLKMFQKHHKSIAVINHYHNLTMAGFRCCRTLTWGLPRSQCSVLWELQCRWSSSCISWSPRSLASTALHSSPVYCHVHRTLPSHRYRDLSYSS